MTFNNNNSKKINLNFLKKIIKKLKKLKFQI